MARIFISYRREDCPYAAHLIYERLCREFNDDVFMDVHKPAPGEFPARISDELNRCAFVVLIVGENLGHLRDPADWVRHEVKAALDRRIDIVPVLVGHATYFEGQELDDDLQQLADMHTVELRAGESLASQLDNLVGMLAQSPKSIRGMFDIALNRIPAGKVTVRHVKDDGLTEEQISLCNDLPFFLATVPVTQGLYEQVRHARPAHFKGPTYDCPGETESNRPVECVSWRDAVAFCNRLSDIENRPKYYRTKEGAVEISGGTGYRLPTETEWHFACQGLRSSKWFFGDDARHLREFAWFYENADGMTHAVGRLEPNPFGLFDVFGNVWEWCWDTPSGNQNDPVGASNSNKRAVCGGACNSPIRQVLARSRQPENVTKKGRFIGFRIARNLE